MFLFHGTAWKPRRLHPGRENRSSGETRRSITCQLDPAGIRGHPCPPSGRRASPFLHRRRPPPAPQAHTSVSVALSIFFANPSGARPVLMWTTFLSNVLSSWTILWLNPVLVDHVLSAVLSSRNTYFAVKRRKKLPRPSDNLSPHIRRRQNHRPNLHVIRVVHISGAAVLGHKNAAPSFLHFYGLKNRGND